MRDVLLIKKEDEGNTRIPRLKKKWEDDLAAKRHGSHQKNLTSTKKEDTRILISRLIYMHLVTTGEIFSLPRRETFFIVDKTFFVFLYFFFSVFPLFFFFLFLVAASSTVRFLPLDFGNLLFVVLVIPYKYWKPQMFSSWTLCFVSMLQQVLLSSFYCLCE